jgi:hypothetical protein
MTIISLITLTSMGVPPYNRPHPTTSTSSFKRRQTLPPLSTPLASTTSTSTIQPTLNPTSSIQSNGFFNDMLSGFSMGIGSGLGHRIINSLLPTTIFVSHSNTDEKKTNEICNTDPCNNEFDDYTKCYKNANSHIELMDCHSKYNLLYECKLRHRKE